MSRINSCITRSLLSLGAVALATTACSVIGTGEVGNVENLAGGGDYVFIETPERSLKF